MSYFEIIMLACFGAAWPLSIIKSYKSRSNKGKSLIFLFVIFSGYLSGILYKHFDAYDEVIYLYYFNANMVFIDIILYFRNKKIGMKNV